MTQIIVDITAVRHGFEPETWYNTEHKMSYPSASSGQAGEPVEPQDGVTHHHDVVHYYFSIMPTTSAAFAEMKNYTSGGLFWEHLPAINALLGMTDDVNYAHAVTLWNEYTEYKTDWYDGTTDINLAVELIGRIDVQKIEVAE